MAFRDLRDMAYSDDEILDRKYPKEPEPPDYPVGLCFSISEKDLEEAGAPGGDHGDVMNFGLMACVTFVHESEDGCRIELEGGMFAGDDGEFHELETPAHICLTEDELSKLGLDSDCEIGDLIHLIGTARLSSRMRSEFGNSCTLQITHLACAEDESEEDREAE